MKEQIKEVLDKYKEKTGSNYGSEYAIYSHRFDRFIDEIENIFNLPLAELKAKIFVYETVIANSNFSPILKENKAKEKYK